MLFGGWFFAVSVKVQRVVVDLDVEDFLDCFFDGLDARIAEFDDFAGVGHDDVVVLFVKIRLFIMRLVLTELVFAHQAAVQQKFDGVVQRGAAYPVVFVLHLDVEILDVEVIFAVVNLL